MKNIFIYLLILSFSISISKNITIFLFEHFRHGARGPTEKDVFNEKWKGKGELTNIGGRMHYLLGVHNKNKYNNFINEIYNPDEILIYSSDKKRTISSILNQIQGMFQNNSNYNILNDNQIKNAVPNFLKNNEKINIKVKELNNLTLPFGIQILPIHIIDNRDKLIKLTSNGICKTYERLKNENLEKKIVKDFFSYFNQEYGKQLINFFGIQNKSFFNSYQGLELICGSFLPDYYDKREIKINDINNNNLYNSCYKYYEIKYTELRIKDNKNEIGLFSMSKFMRKILFYIEENINRYKNPKKKNNTNFPKFLIYSGHDTTMSEMQDFLRIIFKIEPKYPSFASNLFIEVLKDEKDNFYVDLVFNDEIQTSFDFNFFKNKIITKSWSDEEIAKYYDFPDF